MTHRTDSSRPSLIRTESLPTWKLASFGALTAGFLWLAQSHSHAMDAIAGVQAVQIERTRMLETQRRRDEAAIQELRERLIRMETQLESVGHSLIRVDTQLEHIANAVGAEKGGE